MSASDNITTLAKTWLEVNGRVAIFSVTVFAFLVLVLPVMEKSDEIDDDTNFEHEYMKQGSTLSSPKLNTSQTMKNAEAAYAIYYGNRPLMEQEIANVQGMPIDSAIKEITPGMQDYYSWRNYNPQDWTDVTQSATGKILIAKNMKNRQYAECLAQKGPADLLGWCRSVNPTGVAKPVLQ